MHLQNTAGNIVVRDYQPLSFSLLASLIALMSKISKKTFFFHFSSVHLLLLKINVEYLKVLYPATHKTLVISQHFIKSKYRTQY